MRPAAAYLAMIDARWKPGGSMAEPGERHDEYQDVRCLLLDGAVERSNDLVALAECIARACMGEDHLWHDLGLPSRAELSSLLHEHFSRLALLNVHGMRWKKFFYKQLCEQAGIKVCRAPSCGVCAHYGECFGNEEKPLFGVAVAA
ncbi:nitrogen fixation protein NifQ [Azoarcus sp. KH32C]|uniref:nitrogen fixation protein NifQ n=1 Tax=Azoarcus sp. KH32C TaxID=748247 RepID=UPI00023865AF|nr:nitrogen fixation protein NifQ [Azoarcus sp. KH32C]BAL23116.1 putative NifQ protein [Azoarcus sp. KH32C]